VTSTDTNAERPSAVKIGIMADSHGDAARITVAAEYFKTCGCTLCIHLGDICDTTRPETAEDCISRLNTHRILAIRGNNDHTLLLKPLCPDPPCDNGDPPGNAVDPSDRISPVGPFTAVCVHPRSHAACRRTWARPISGDFSRITRAGNSSEGTAISRKSFGPGKHPFTGKKYARTDLIR
jgi:hypothetical protein